MLKAQSKVKKINEARKEEEFPANEDVAVEEEGIKLVVRLLNVFTWKKLVPR